MPQMINSGSYVYSKCKAWCLALAAEEPAANNLNASISADV